MNVQESAETLALEALAWLAGQDGLLPAFLAASGLEAGQIAAAAAQPEFLAGVLDFLLQDDAWVMGFCEARGLPYTAPAQARAALPGGAIAWD
jgi:hypothetical protein